MQYIKKRLRNGLIECMNDYGYKKVNQQKSCGIFIFNKKLELLLCHPTNHPKDFWSIPKGLSDGNESFLKAAFRGVLEETGIDYFNYKREYFKNLEYRKYNNGSKILIPFAIFDEPTYSELRCESMISGTKIPEVDDYDWVYWEDAFDLLHETQFDSLEEIELKYIKGKTWLKEYKMIDKNMYV